MDVDVDNDGDGDGVIGGDVGVGNTAVLMKNIEAKGSSDGGAEEEEGYARERSRAAKVAAPLCVSRYVTALSLSLWFLIHLSLISNCFICSFICVNFLFIYLFIFVSGFAVLVLE